MVEHHRKSDDTASQLNKLKLSLWSTCRDLEVDDEIKEVLIESIVLQVKNHIGLSTLQEKLEILYEYEKHHLDLLKEYKEEIKFAASIQEELRKERTKFFAESLKEVSETLRNSQVGDKVASVWITELVESYTRSLDLSSSLVEDNTLNVMGEIRQDAKQEMKSVKDASEF